MADKYGTDALRFALITDSSPGNDQKFSEAARRAGRTLRQQALERHAVRPVSRLD